MSSKRPRVRGRLPAVWLFAIVAIAVFLTRLPFIFEGYGVDPDAWRVVNVARQISATGQYVTSRLPGYPVQEVIYSWLWEGGPLVLNGLTALLSALGVGFFTLSMRAIGCKHYWIGGMALAGTPIIYVHSTNSMDYLWALAFILASFHAVISRRTMISGILLGFAIGCRITSGAMLLPLAFLVVSRRKGQGSPVPDLAKLVLSACAVGAMLYFPVVARYGSGFFSFFEPPYPPLGELVRGATFGTFGAIGTAAIGFAAALMFLKFRDHWGRLRAGGDLAVASSLAIVLYTAAYFRLPAEAGYMIPTVPFAILLMALALRAPWFHLVSAVLILSSFVSVSREHGLGPGLLLTNQFQRRERGNYVQAVVERANRLTEPTAIVAGAWRAQIEETIGVVYVDYTDWRPQFEMTPEAKPAIVEFAPVLDAPMLDSFLDHGYKIYYLRGVGDAVREFYAVDLEDYGRPFPLGPDDGAPE